MLKAAADYKQAEKVGWTSRYSMPVQVFHMVQPRFIIYLNGDFEGGCTTFYTPNSGSRVADMRRVVMMHDDV